MTDVEYMHELLLATFDEFIDVCTKYKLNWFVDGGTLLGVVRNNSIIPWDDDIDILMPRKDYNVFIELAKTCFNRPSFFQSIETDDKWFCPSVRLLNLSGYIKRNEEDVCKFKKGFYIDILPLDAVSTDEKELDYIRGYVSSINKFGAQRYVSHLEYNQYLNYEVCLHHFKSMNGLLSSINEVNLFKSNSKLACCQNFFNKEWSTQLFDKSDYARYKLYRMNGLTNSVRVPEGYDNILRAWYGSDYMKPKKNLSGHEYFSNCSIIFN